MKSHESHEKSWKMKKIGKSHEKSWKKWNSGKNPKIKVKFQKFLPSGRLTFFLMKFKVEA